MSLSFKSFFNLIINNLWGLSSVNSLHLVLCLIKLDDGHTLLLENGKPFLEHLNVVIVPCCVSGCGGSCLDTSDHCLFCAFEEKHEFHIGVFAHDLEPSLIVVLISGEAIDQVLFIGPPVLLHSFFNQLDCDLDWDNFALEDDAVNQIAIWRTAISLIAGY